MRFLRTAVAYYASLGVRIRRLLTDNGSAFRSKAFAQTCAEFSIRHGFTRPYRPQNQPQSRTLHPIGSARGAYGFVYPTRPSELLGSIPGSITTTCIAHIKASEASHPCPGSPRSRTTS